MITWPQPPAQRHFSLCLPIGLSTLCLLRVSRLYRFVLCVLVTWSFWPICSICFPHFSFSFSFSSPFFISLWIRMSQVQPEKAKGFQLPPQKVSSLLFFFYFYFYFFLSDLFSSTSSFLVSSLRCLTTGETFCSTRPQSAPMIWGLLTRMVWALLIFPSFQAFCWPPFFCFLPSPVNQSEKDFAAFPTYPVVLNLKGLTSFAFPPILFPTDPFFFFFSFLLFSLPLSVGDSFDVVPFGVPKKKKDADGLRGIPVEIFFSLTPKRTSFSNSLSPQSSFPRAFRSTIPTWFFMVSRPLNSWDPCPLRASLSLGAPSSVFTTKVGGLCFFPIISHCHPTCEINEFM